MIEKLKEKRIAKEYSLEYVQVELRNRFDIDLDISNISRYENGKVKKMDAKVLKALCKIYDLDYIKLFKQLGFIDEEDLQEKNSMNNNNSVGFMGNTGNIHIHHLDIRNGLASTYTENEIIDKINALPREFQKDIFEFIDFKYMMYEKEQKG